MGDTVFVTFLIAHLKAGSSSSDASARYTQVEKLMNKLTQIGRADNYILSGDFNLYGSDEASYQYLIHYPNSLYQFYDPIDQEGAWNNNYNYRYIHTQSTHTYSDEGECFASGGMDDRFDFILVSPYIYYGSNGLQAIPILIKLWDKMETVSTELLFLPPTVQFLLKLAMLFMIYPTTFRSSWI
jgi:hypothetical protein